MYLLLVQVCTRTAFATGAMGWQGDWLEARLPGPDAGEQSPHVVGARTKRARSRGEVKEDVGSMNDEQASARDGWRLQPREEVRCKPTRERWSGMAFACRVYTVCVWVWVVVLVLSK